jgi:hypothetical protein
MITRTKESAENNCQEGFRSPEKIGDPPPSFSSPSVPGSSNPRSQLQSPLFR